MHLATKTTSLFLVLMGMTLMSAGTFAGATELEGPGCRSFTAGVGEGPDCGGDANVLAMRESTGPSNTFIVLDGQGCLVGTQPCSPETEEAALASLDERETNMARFQFTDGSNLLVARGPSCSVYVGSCTDDGSCTYFVGSCSLDGDCNIYVGTCSGNGDCSIYVGHCYGDCKVFVGTCYGECEIFIGVCYDGGTCKVFVGTCSYDGQCSIFVGTCHTDSGCTVFVGSCGPGPNQVMYNGYHFESADANDDAPTFTNHRDANAYTVFTFHAV